VDNSSAFPRKPHINAPKTSQYPPDLSQYPPKTSPESPNLSHLTQQAFVKYTQISPES
jgi:hypothetical protein